MTTYSSEKYLEAIARLGDNILEEMYSLLGSEKISFAALRNMNRKRKILMNNSGKRSVTRIAKENGVSRMTVYRLIRKKKKGLGR
ncbi:MAG: helix-turn-helix domain-containing protein [Bacteroidota bacterium]